MEIGACRVFGMVGVPVHAVPNGMGARFVLSIVTMSFRYLSGPVRKGKLLSCKKRKIVVRRCIFAWNMV